jgi:hypothetical protein
MEIPYRMAVSFDSPDCTNYNAFYTIDFGDGPPTPFFAGTHTYATAGSYHWRAQYTNQQTSCTVEGDITVVDCVVSVKVQATPQEGGDPPMVNFTSRVEEKDCYCCPSTATQYLWKFRNGDGEGLNSSEPNPSYQYFGPSPYQWGLTVGDCRRSVDLCGVLPSCLSVGSLKLCGDQIAKVPGEARYTLTGNVTINDMVFFTEPLTLEGDPISGEGILTTDGLVQVASGPVKETLFSGVGLPIEIDGKAGTLEPATPDPDFKYGFTLGGVTLVAKGTPIEVGEDQVTVTPTFFVGIEPLFTLAEVKTTIIFPKGQWKELTGLSLVSAKVLQAPVLEMEGKYTPEAGVFELKAAIGFPFVEAPSVSGGFSLWYGCFNGWEAGVEARREALLDFSLRGRAGEVSGATLGMDHICDQDPFKIYIAGSLVLKELDEDYFGLKDIRLEYEHPLVFNLSGGGVIFMAYPVGEMRGTLRLKPDNPVATFRWKVNLATVFQADMNVYLSVNRKLFTMNAGGALVIPEFDFNCGTYNYPCKALRRAIKAAVTLPYTVDGVQMDGAIQKMAGGDWDGHLRGPVILGPLSAVAELQFHNLSWSLLVGRNYQNLYEVGRVECATVLPLAQEKPVDVPAGRPAVLFSGASDGTIPALYLMNPAGQRITPDTVGSFPGVTYLSDATDGLAIFQVLAPAAGMWTLGQDGLPPEQVTLMALSPTPAPEVAFASAQQSGNSVSMSATVTPATPETTLGFLYAKNPGGLDADWIAVDVPAGTGQAAATWDISEVETGTYYLLARTDDGMNPPVTAVYPDPIVVNRGLVQAPTGLTGTRSGTEASLHWTASATPGPLQHQVLYTDAPNVPGYPFLRTAAMPEEALIGGLDETRAYRFCVVAYDEAGNRSIESAPWASYPPGSVPGDCDGNGNISIGEVQKAINMFLGSLPPGCGVDCNGDGTVSIGEVQKVINGFLGLAASC